MPEPSRQPKVSASTRRRQGRGAVSGARVDEKFMSFLKSLTVDSNHMHLTGRSSRLHRTRLGVRWRLDCALAWRRGLFRRLGQMDLRRIQIELLRLAVAFDRHAD